MIRRNGDKCPKCKGEIKYYDTVVRTVILENHWKARLAIKRYRCVNCKSVHRMLPKYILPYKQYHAKIIQGVIDGDITEDLIDYEDYPCSETMKRWKKQKKK